MLPKPSSNHFTQKSKRTCQGIVLVLVKGGKNNQGSVVTVSSSNILGTSWNTLLSMWAI